MRPIRTSDLSSLSVTFSCESKYFALFKGPGHLLSSDLGSDGGLEVSDGDINHVVTGLLFGGEGCNLVDDPGNENLALRSDELRKDGKKVGHGL